MLTDAALKHLKPKEKIYKVTDRDGMYVLVKPSGTMYVRPWHPVLRHLAEAYLLRPGPPVDE